MKWPNLHDENGVIVRPCNMWELDDEDPSAQAHIGVIYETFTKDEMIAIGEAIKAYGESMP